MSLLISLLTISNLLCGAALVFFGPKIAEETQLLPPNISANFLFYLGVVYVVKGITLIFVMKWKKWAVKVYVAGVILTTLANLSLGATAGQVLTIESIVCAYIVWEARKGWKYFD